MKPILFDEATTEFITNGIGRLSDAISCICTEERNGVYEVEMVYPVSGIHYSDIRIRNIIVVKPSANADLQAFRIYKITKPINGKVSVFAQHLTYDLSKNTCMPFSVTASASACNSVLQGLKTNAVETCPFSFWTNVDTIAPYSQKIPSSIRQRLGGIEGSVIDQFGGEYEWDNYTIKLHKNRGERRPITLRYGKNITDINQEENIANTVTGIVPFWSDANSETVVTLPEKAVYCPIADRYSSKLTVPYDFSSRWDEAPTQEQLRNAARAYVNRSGFGVPVVSIKVSFVNLADTEEYKNILPLENTNLCDIITVQFAPLGVDTTAKIVKTTYDVLKEKYDEIQVGDLRSTISSTISNIESGMAQEITDTFAKTGSLIDNATAWLTGADGYVVARKDTNGTWKELLFLDTNDIDEAHNVLRINQNGIGFSRNGVNGPYGQAWTLDGRLVIGGTNVPSITVYDSDDNIIFQADADAVIWNATNSSMDSTGRITCDGATLTDVDINGGEITMVGANSWLALSDGDIKGGRGTTPYRNTTYIYFDQLVNNQPGYLGFNARGLFIKADEIAVTRNRSDSNGTNGYDGYVLSSIDFDFDTDEYVCNLAFDMTPQFIIAGTLQIDFNDQSWSWDAQNALGSASWSDVSAVSGISANWDRREVIHGIVT